MILSSLTTQHLAIIERFEGASVLVVGDVMLDNFVYGEAERISPEAPIPVLRIVREQRMLGGAGNVIRNIAALGAKSHLVCVMGNDTTAHDIAALLQKEPRVGTRYAYEHQRCSTVKTRYIAGAQQLLRCDHEDVTPATPASVDAMLEHCRDAVTNHNIMVLSDYAKGTLPAPFIRSLITLANEHHIPVFIDPKQWDISLYSGATLISPNEKEMQLLHRAPFAHDDEMIDVARDWCATHHIGYILATRGSKGMMLISRDGLQAHIRAAAREVFDVSGAGDTALATLAVAYGCGASMEDAMRLANHAAGIAVGRIGTATVHRTDLKTAVHTSHLTTGAEKIFSRDAAIATVQSWQAQGLKVGFTNGCFDVVHAGHINSIARCAAECDRLVLAINSDASVKRLKGDSRPIHHEMDRAMLLAALSAVDMVVIFREDTPEPLLRALRPDVLMKGEDYQKEQIIGWEFVESYGGVIVRIPLVEGYSSTNTIARIQGVH